MTHAPTSRRFARRFFSCLLCAVLTAALAAPARPLAAQSSASQQLQSEVDRLQQQLDAINGQIESTKDSIEDTAALKGYYQQQAAALQAQIAALQAGIAAAQTDLAAQKDALGQKILQVADTRALFRERLRAMYVARGESRLEVLLGARTFSEMLRWSENSARISRSNTALIERLRTEEAELAAQQAQMEADLTALRAAEDQLAQKSSEYAVSIQHADAALSADEAELAAQQEAYGATYEELQQAKDELQAWIANDNTVDFEYGGGAFAWPLPGYTRVSSQFGWRTLWGRPDFHRGVDFSAPAGVPIAAAESGVVSTLAHWSYGTCVKISHGSGLVTVYAHMSARADGIADGVHVAKGQTIGYVGSTGNSSGNHLHFEVNLNGEVMNPWPYLNG